MMINGTNVSANDAIAWEICTKLVSMLDAYEHYQKDITVNTSKSVSENLNNFQQGYYNLLELNHWINLAFMPITESLFIKMNAASYSKDMYSYINRTYDRTQVSRSFNDLDNIYTQVSYTDGVTTCWEIYSRNLKNIFDNKLRYVLSTLNKLKDISKDPDAEEEKNEDDT